MDIDCSRGNGFMSKYSPDRKEVSTVLIQMGAKCMSEGVAGQAFWPSETFLMSVDMS